MIEDVLYAHSIPDAPVEAWQLLSDHLSTVSAMARGFSAPFGAGEWAALAGLTHDAGKASSAFQRRLQGSSEKVDHSTAGAQLLVERYGDIGRLLAYIVAGHHGGMPNCVDSGNGNGSTSLEERLGKKVEPYERFFEVVDMPDARQVVSAMPEWLRSDMTQEQRAFAFPFLMKMLFSSVVDADFLDTERVVYEQRFNRRCYAGKTLPEMRRILRSHIEGLSKQASAGNREVSEARSDIASACVEVAAGSPGLYSLTVPTGGGKTFASMSFALEHALKNGHQRVIYAAPYTSVIEQTAQVFKGLFGVESVLEHHSNYGFDDMPDDESAISQRLCMENWDVPLIVTTNVQLFESLYSAKTSRCRKVHNIANSVIILDEVQTLPDGLLKPCLAALEELCAHYGATVVLCTATQPALDAVWPFSSRPTDIVPVMRRHADVFSKRSTIECFAGESLGETPLSDLVESFSAAERALCIVSSRLAASKLYDAVVAHRGSGHVYHLSALMVPEHRSQVIEQVKEDLEEGKPCLVVSTQLIEAGVDIDFPMVFREVAGIDSIQQAAGRCNREGKGPMGKVFVFDCPELSSPQTGWLSRMRMLGREVIERCDEWEGPAGVELFFKKRYIVEDTDSKRVFTSMSDKFRVRDCNWEFERYGRDFKFIDDAGIDIFVPWGERGCDLLASMRAGQLDIALSRKAQRFTVSVPRRQFEKLLARNVSRIGPYCVLEPFNGQIVGYSNEKGLVVDDLSATLMV